MENKKAGYIYFMTNDYNTTFYVGVTSNLKRRIYEHKNKLIEGFTKKYNLIKFIYYEKYSSITDAIKREKQIKNFKKEWKIDLIKKSNPSMTDLYYWLEGNLNNKLNITTKIVEENDKIYEVPHFKDNAIAGQARNDDFLCQSPQTHNYSEFAEQTCNNRIFYDKCTKVQCPAKINLTLKVLNKREDGFHNIESIMQTISLYDYLTISAEPSQETEIILAGNSTEIPYNEKNLVYKAVQLFPMEPHRIKIYIEKNIPVSAGLAGGSTNAAGALFGLNEILGKPLDKSQLHELCAKLGSDLNFCLEGGRQMTKGRGEILEPLPFEEFNVSLIKPENLGISAKEAYTKFSEKKSNPLSNSLPRREDFENDLEWAVIDDYKELQTIKNLYPNSMMSGSGSTYFIINDKFKKQKGYWICNNLHAIPNGIKKIPLVKRDFEIILLSD